MRSFKYPNIIITVTDSNSEKLARYVKNGVVDLAIINMPIENEKIFNITKITKTHDCFIANINFDKNYLSKQELTNQKLIVQKRPSSNRDYFDKMCQQNGVALIPSFEIGSFGLITDFVKQNLGIAYTIKEFIEDDITQKQVKVIDTDFVSKPRDVAVITLQTSTNSFACDTFIKELKSYYNKKQQK